MPHPAAEPGLAQDGGSPAAPARPTAQPEVRERCRPQILALPIRIALILRNHNGGVPRSPTARFQSGMSLPWDG